MSQAITEKSVYREAFEAARRSGEPSWLTRLRAGALERFEELGFPTTEQEDWKYTSVAPVARAAYLPAPAAGEGITPETVERFVSEEARRSRLVFVDGRFRPELSSLAALGEGVVAADLTDALRGPHAELVRGSFEAADAGPGATAFESLNAALTDGGAFVFVPAGVRAAAPLQLLFLSASPETASFPRVLVVAERGSGLDLIESYAAAGEHPYLTNAVVGVSVGEGARVTHYKVQDEGGAAFHVAATRAEVGRDAVYDLTTVTLGARLSRHDITVSLGREGAECSVDGLYIVGAGQHADTHSLIDHLRPHGTSRQNYKGILDGKSRAVFNGRVFVHRDAQQTDAVQSNKNLLLSSEARVDTKPQLEIYADDVKCAHGATVGQLEEEELFYLLSRGLHPDLARNLLTYGFAEEIVEKVKFDSIRAQLDEAILNRLHARLEA